MNTTVSAVVCLSVYQLTLHLLKHVRADDGFVVAFHIVLRNFTLVDFFLLSEEVHSVGLLKERIALVFFVGKDTADGSGIPFIFTAG